MPKLQSLQNKRRHILAHLATLHSMRRGCLNKRLNVCGKPNCACKGKPPKLHGPYFFITTKLHGKTRCHYVEDKRLLPLLRQQLRAHQKFRQWINQFLVVCEEIAEIQLQEVKGAKK